MLVYFENRGQRPVVATLSHAETEGAKASTSEQEINPGLGAQLEATTITVVEK